MILKQTGKDVPRGAFDRGVLTATDSQFFPAVHATAISLKRQRIQYAVVDHGLAAEQLDELAKLDVLLLDDRLTGDCEAWGLSKKCPDIPTKTWRKPFLCGQSPFQLTAWIDADAIPLGFVSELFQWPRGFITADHFVDDVWAADIYTPLVEAVGGEQILRINSGVFAFGPSCDWLFKWQQMCNAVLADRRLAALAHCRDQSALIAALSLMSPQQRPLIVTQSHWNYPADGRRNTLMHLRLRDYPKDGPGLLEFASARHPGATVVHWMGPLKPWRL